MKRFRLTRPFSLMLLILLFGVMCSVQAQPATGQMNRSTFTDSNTTAITIVDAPSPNVPSASDPYGTKITVSGVTGNIIAILIGLYGIDHQWAADMDILLVGPGGQNLMIVSDIANTSGQHFNNTNIVLDDAAEQSLPNNGGPTEILSGSYKPTNLSNPNFGCENIDAAFPAPAPVISNNTTFAQAFGGLTGDDVNGDWSLYIVDDCHSSVGSLSGGWSISITTDGTFGATELITNGGFEPDATGWTLKNPTGDKVQCDTLVKTVAFEGDCAFRFKGGAGESSVLSQTADISNLTFNTGDTLDLSAELAAKNAAVSGSVITKVTYSDATPAIKLKSTFFQTDGGIYELLSAQGTLASGAVASIKTKISHKSLVGKLYLDAVSLEWTIATGASALVPLPN